MPASTNKSAHVAVLGLVENPLNPPEAVKKFGIPLLHLPRRGGEKERGQAITNFFTASLF
jgi:hypothetical protein